MMEEQAHSRAVDEGGLSLFTRFDKPRKANKLTAILVTARVDGAGEHCCYCRAPTVAKAVCKGLAGRDWAPTVAGPRRRDIPNL